MIIKSPKADMFKKICRHRFVTVKKVLLDVLLPLFRLRAAVLVLQRLFLHLSLTLFVKLVQLQLQNAVLLEREVLLSVTSVIIKFKKFEMKNIHRLKNPAVYLIKNERHHPAVGADCGPTIRLHASLKDRN